MTIESQRLILRPWRPEDREPFAEMSADKRVMEFLGGVLTRAESDAMADRIDGHFAKHGFGPFAAELRDWGTFIGFIGLAVPDFEAPFTPCVEILWRLGAPYWNRGLATEGARKVRDYAFQTLKLDEIVSFTVPTNTASRRVMEKLGMTHNPADDFDHPRMPAGSPLRRHVLYRRRAK